MTVSEVIMKISYDSEIGALYVRLVDDPQECRTVALNEEITSETAERTWQTSRTWKPSAKTGWLFRTTFGCPSATTIRRQWMRGRIQAGVQRQGRCVRSGGR